MDVLADLATIGGFGVLHCGATLADVENALGPAETYGILSDHEEDRWPRMFGYANAELAVCRCREIAMVLVQTHYDEPVKLPLGASPVLTSLATGVRRSDLVHRLEGYEEHHRPDLDATYLDFSDAALRISFVFSFEEGFGDERRLVEDPLLHKVVVTRTGHECPA